MVSRALPLLGVLLLGLALRVAVLGDLPREIRGDSQQFLLLARNLAEGRGFSHSPQAPYRPDAVRTPGFVAFLLPAVVLAPDPAPAVYALQVALDLATVAGVYALVALLGPGPLRPTLAAGLYSLHPVAAALTGQVLPDTAANALVVLALLLVARPGPLPAASGALSAMLALTKPALLPFVVLLHAVLAATRRPGAAAALGLLLLLLVPWTFRNGVAVGVLTPTSAAGFGATLWHGVARDAVPPLTQEGAEEWSRYVDLWRPGGDLTPEETRELDARLGAIAREAILRDPLAYVRHVVWRLAAFWVRAEGLGQNVPAEAQPRALAWTRAARVYQCLLLLAALVGLLRSRSALGDLRLHLALLLYLSTLYPAVHVEGRYLLPALPSLCLLASLAAAPLRRRSR